MNSSDGALKAFATFRVTGDSLVPPEITDALFIYPTKTYRKGEQYFAGDNSGYVVGRTGVWYLSTDRLVPGNNLDEHALFLSSILVPEICFLDYISPSALGRLIVPMIKLHKLETLSQILRKRDLTSTLTLFWHGDGRKKPPAIPKTFDIAHRIAGIGIEPDFAAEEDQKRDVA